MRKPKKLKRGLKDISPLFAKEQKAEGEVIARIKTESETAKETTGRPEKSKLSKTIPANSLQCLSVFSPDSPEDMLLMETYLSSKIVMRGQPCVVVSLGSQGELNWTPLTRGEKFDAKQPHHLNLSWDDFYEMTNTSSLLGKSSSESWEPMLFLNFDLMQVPSFAPLARIMDKWILHLRPNLESMSECYKLIKAALTWKPNLEFFMLYDGDEQDPKASLFFNEFSELVSKKFGIQLVWLGSFNVALSGGEIASELAIDHLFLNSITTRVNREKRALADYSRQILQEQAKQAI